MLLKDCCFFPSPVEYLSDSQIGTVTCLGEGLFREGAY